MCELLSVFQTTQAELAYGAGNPSVEVALRFVLNCKVGGWDREVHRYLCVYLAVSAYSQFPRSEKRGTTSC